MGRMRNVTRGPMPGSLKANSRRWTDDLLQALKREKQKKTPVPLSLYTKYKKEGIREALSDMYQGLCCYCEVRVAPVSFEHIEHRKPKSKFPRDTYNWSNLHLVCSQCNTEKGDKWDGRFPILDAVTDRIDQHLSYILAHSGVLRHGTSKRGKTTIEHADLNRDKLCERRSVIVVSALHALAELTEAEAAMPASSSIAEIGTKISGLGRGEYGSLFTWASWYIHRQPRGSSR